MIGLKQVDRKHRGGVLQSQSVKRKRGWYESHIPEGAKEGRKRHIKSSHEERQETGGAVPIGRQPVVTTCGQRGRLMTRSRAPEKRPEPSEIMYGWKGRLVAPGVPP